MNRKEMHDFFVYFQIFTSFVSKPINNLAIYHRCMGRIQIYQCSGYTNTSQLFTRHTIILTEQLMYYIMTKTLTKLDSYRLLFKHIDA